MSIGTDPTGCLRDMQATAIKARNAPHERKQLRRFPTAEAADMLGIADSYLRELAVGGNGFPAGDTENPRKRTFSLADVGAARQWLFAKTRDPKYRPGRDLARGDKLSVTTFVNFKGGAGKTTTSCHFAQHLARAGWRVLLIDLDAQGSATAQFGIDADAEVTPDSCFAGWVSQKGERGPDTARRSIQRTYWPNIDLVPAGAALQSIEYDLVKELDQPKQEAAAEHPWYDHLRSFLATVEAGYDAVVVDCRPDVNMMMINSLHAATGVVVPVPMTMTDIASTGEFFRFLRSYTGEARKTISDGELRFDFLRLLATRFQATDGSQANLLHLFQGNFADIVLAEPMVHTALVGSAGLSKQTLYEWQPTDSRRTYERALDSLNRVNRAIAAEIEAAWRRDAERRAAPAPKTRGRRAEAA